MKCNINIDKVSGTRYIPCINLDIQISRNELKLFHEICVLTCILNDFPQYFAKLQTTRYRLLQ